MITSDECPLALPVASSQRAERSYWSGVSALVRARTLLRLSRIHLPSSPRRSAPLPQAGGPA